MNSYVKHLLSLMILAGLITSCQTTSSLGDGKIFQKRKYTKGYHINVKKAIKNKSNQPVTAKSFEEIGLEKIEEQPLFGVKPITRNAEKRKLVTASMVSVKEEVKVQKKTRNVISLPILINEAFAKPPESIIEQPAPAGAIIGFISSIIGIFFAGIILGTLAIVLCAIALGKIKENSGMKGRGLAIAGIVIGIIAVLGALIVISMMA